MQSAAVMSAMQHPDTDGRMSWLRAVCRDACSPARGVFCFVGWNKAFAALADLARYGAWTVWLPEWLGRLVGWSEMACAVALLGVLVPGRERIARAAAAILAANQVVAGAMHLVHAESARCHKMRCLWHFCCGIVLAAANSRSGTRILPVTASSDSPWRPRAPAA